MNAPRRQHRNGRYPRLGCFRMVGQLGRAESRAADTVVVDALADPGPENGISSLTRCTTAR